MQLQNSANVSYLYAYFDAHNLPFIQFTVGTTPIFLGKGNGTIITYQTYATIVQTASDWIIEVFGFVTDSPTYIGIDIIVLDRIIQHYDTYIEQGNCLYQQFTILGKSFTYTFNISRGIEEASVFYIHLIDPFIDFTLTPQENQTQFILPTPTQQTVFNPKDLTVFLNGIT